MWIVLPALALALTWVLLLLGVEPVPTWFYVFAWYPTLFLFDGLACRLDRRGHLLAQVPLAVSLFVWSAPIWLFFEAVNFRLRNWYYVYLPRAPLERWAGILLSFATVVPAVVLAERLLRAAGRAVGWDAQRGTQASTDEHGRAEAIVGGLAWTGWAMLAAVLAFPRWLYPLTWGAMLLVADPIVYRRRPEWSLIADLERGEWGRVTRLMLGGLLIGGIWEGYNFVARGKWIYTVPLLEHLKWFEMPPLGFVGFPFFALEAWAMYHALAVLGVAAPNAARPDTPVAPVRPWSPPLAVGLAAVLSVATLLGMERWTISSTVPVIELPAAPELTSPWTIARIDPADLAERVGVSTDSARRIRDRAQLITLRGIGSEHADRLIAAGVTSVCRLAEAEAQDVWRRLHDVDPAPRPTEPEVGVWVRAARRVCQVA